MFDQGKKRCPILNLSKSKMLRFFWILLYLLSGVVNGDNHNNNQLPNRSVIVQLFEWKWLDIADECETFLGPKGYGAIQTSPASENLIVHINEDRYRPWYERYQVMSYKLQTRSGDENDFREMTTRCNRAGVRVYVDVVFNHMTGDGLINKGTDGSTADFANNYYPAVPYSNEHFNQPPCDINNFDNATEVRVCRLVGLKDLNSTIPYVQQKIAEYLNKLISLGVAGFRVDAAKHMWPNDLNAIYSSLNNLNTSYGFQPNSKAFVYQEVSRGGVVEPNDYTYLGYVTEFTVVAVLYQALTQDGLQKLKGYASPIWYMLPSGSALVFVDNHDTQRAENSLNYKYSDLYKIATTFLLAHPYGQPRVMSSFYFNDTNEGPPMTQDGQIVGRSIMQNGSCDNDWVCEHRRPSTYRMVEFRNIVGDAKLKNWWDNGNNQIAFGRGNRGFVVLNNEGTNLNANLQTGLPPGTYCDIISSTLNNGVCTGKTVQVSQDGTAQINLSASETQIAIHVGPQSRFP